MNKKPVNFLKPKALFYFDAAGKPVRMCGHVSDLESSENVLARERMEAQLSETRKLRR